MSVNVKTANGWVKVAGNAKRKDDVIIFVGDSYGWSPGSDVNKGWINKTMALIPNKCYRCNATGGSFGNNVKFLDILKTIESQVTDKNEVTRIIVCGGYNDIDNTLKIPELEGVVDGATMAGIQAFSEYCATTYPNAMIELGIIALTTDVDNMHKLMTKTIGRYRQGAYTFKNISFIEGSQYIFKRYNLLGEDGIHPIEGGSNVISMCLANYIKNGTVLTSLQGSYSAPAIVLNDLFADGTLPLQLRVYDYGESYHIEFETGFPVLKTATLFNTFVEIGTLQNGWIKGIEGFDMPFSVGLQVNNVWQSGSGVLRIKDNVVYLQLVSFDYATSLWFPKFSFDVSKNVC